MPENQNTLVSDPPPAAMLTGEFLGVNLATGAGGSGVRAGHPRPTSNRRTTDEVQSTTGALRPSYFDLAGVMADELTEYREAACEAARRGAAVLEEWRTRFTVREKARFDLVTDADLGSQRAIRSYLLQRFPDHGFLGEEENAGESRPGPDAPPTWIVDPLDGTTNYVHDCPL